VLPAIVLVLVLIAGLVVLTRTFGADSDGDGTEPTAQQSPTTTEAGVAAPTTVAGAAPGQGGQDQGQQGQAPDTTGAPVTTGAPGTTAGGGSSGGSSGGTGGGTGSAPGAASGGIANAGFESGEPLDGWEGDGVQVQLVRPGWQSPQALGLRPDPDAPPGEDAAAAVTTNIGGTFGKGRTVTVSAWVRTTSPGTEARLSLTERRSSGLTDAVKVPLYDTGWHQVAVRHKVSVAGTRLQLRVGTDPRQAGSVLVVDAVRRT
jgi:hypothetical protein